MNYGEYSQSYDHLHFVGEYRDNLPHEESPKGSTGFCVTACDKHQFSEISTEILMGYYTSTEDPELVTCSRCKTSWEYIEATIEAQHE